MTRIKALLPVLRHRQYRLLLGGQTVSLLGDSLLPVALAFAVLDDLDGGAGDVGLVLAARTLPLGLLVLAAGVWADRFPRRTLMLISDCGRAAVQAVLAVLLIRGEATLESTMACAAVYGAFEAFFRPAAGGLVPQLVPRGELQQANALYAIAIDTGFILGPVVGGVLVVGVGAGWAIAFDALTFVISAAFLVALRAPAVDRAAAGGGFWSQLRGGLDEVRSRSWAKAGLFVLGAYHLVALPALLGLGPVLADRELNGAATYATTVTAFGIGSVLGSLISLRVTISRPMLVSAAAFMLASCQPIVYALGGSTLVISAGLAVCGVGVSLGFLQWETTLGREIPEHAISRVTSLDYFVTMLLMPIGYAAVPPLATVFGLHEVMIVAGLLSIGVAAAALAVPGVRSLRAAPA